MAATYDADTESATTGATSLTFALTVANQAERGIIMGVSAWDPTAGDTLPSGITYAGATLDRAIGNRLDANGNRSTLKGKTAPATGANNVVVTMPNACEELGANALSAYAVDQTTPFGTYASAEGVASPATVNVSAAVGDLVYDVLYGNGTPAQWTADASQATRAEQAITGDAVCLASTEAGAATVTMSWTKTGSVAWCQSAVSLKAAAAGGVIEADGSASGTGASSVIAAALWNTVIAAAGVAASVVAGAALWLTVIASVGVAGGDAPSGAFFQGAGASVGVGTADGLGAAYGASPGSATGLATVSGTSGATVATLGSSEGIASVSGVGEDAGGSTASSSGAAIVEGLGVALWSSGGSGDGIAVLTGVGAAPTSVVGGSVGLAVALGISDAPGPLKYEPLASMHQRRLLLEQGKRGRW